MTFKVETRNVNDELFICREISSLNLNEYWFDSHPDDITYRNIDESQIAEINVDHDFGVYEAQVAIQ